MLVNLGVSYKKAPLAILDALTLRNLPLFYRSLKKTHGVKGAIVIQTCNRVDIFLDAIENRELNEKILRDWALQTKFKLPELRRLAEQRTGDQALRYLVSLASGLESMLVGENQILGQVKSALIEARGLAVSSPMLSKSFELCLASAARIRDQTGIGRGTVSLGSAAVKLAEESLGPIDHRSVLLLGTGEIGMILMKALKARGFSDVTVAGRTRQRTDSFCRTFGGKPSDFKHAISQLGMFRLVIVATRASGFLLTKENVLPQRIAGKNQKLMILDLSIPRNASPDLAEVDGVSIKTIDDLREITSQAVSIRKVLIDRSQPMIEEAVENISALLRREEAEPMLSDLYHRAEKIRREELEKTLSKLDLPPEKQEVVERMSHSLVRKILAQPSINLREAAKKGDTKLLTVAGQIFEGE